MAAHEDQLCTQCGLCCDGSLFADVELRSRREATRAEAMGLQIDDDERVFLLPCSALQNKRCGIYRFRPNCCRNFECRLLKQVKQGAITLPEARSQIAAVFHQIGTIDKLLARAPIMGERNVSLAERCQEALAAEVIPAKAAVLESAMARMDILIQRTFFG